MISPSPTDPAPAPKVATAAPTVEISPLFAAGETVRHVNGQTYIVRAVTPEGVSLEGVGNLVHPSALRKI